MPPRPLNPKTPQNPPNRRQMGGKINKIPPTTPPKDGNPQS